ncbi:hypothetical protein TD95_001259 [Thielaviopsis punctulata]|uniref:Alpha/beta hydrolase fold-3 domain-containing protein n=1 Tax=Thielaviopsis punctulata TaxID=72032 RepID=A0A0F4ZAW3_9PEZI|nr:hypothetical protein TD95_001259 [Thielaviopsis punctulata]
MSWFDFSSCTSGRRKNISIDASSTHSLDSGSTANGATDTSLFAVPPSEFATSFDCYPRWLLAARVYALRTAASLAFSCISPLPCEEPQTTTVLYLDSTLGTCQGPRCIPVHVWMPEPTLAPHALRTAIINFHGGGFVLGQGTDDCIWTSLAQQELDAVVFSVEYRLAPGYPFPKSIEDCVDAVLQIAARASEFGIDASKILLSGFSAGGSLALSTWVVLQDPGRWGYCINQPMPVVQGMLLFYPGLDWSITRDEKRRGCARPDLTLPPSMTDLFDCSYIYPHLSREGRQDLRLSPGLMEDELVKKLPRIHFCLCEHDMLLAEEFRFIDRLKAANKDVSHRIVLDEKHAWDKPMPVAPKPSVFEEYRAALDEAKRWLNLEWTEVDLIASASTETLTHSRTGSKNDSSRLLPLPFVMERSVSGSSMEPDL